jgi:phosphoribosyl 1,2-cyclic phosphodiesterase
MNFEVLASSSAGCCYRLSGGGAKAPILIEAGIRFQLIQQGLNFQVSQLAGCLVSHCHGDHARAIGDLMHVGVPVYTSAGTWSVYKGKRNPVLEKTLTAREVAQVGDWTVLPFEAVHDAPGTLGFIIGSPSGERLLFLTDSAYCPYKFEGLTHIAVEANFDLDIMRANVASGEMHGGRVKRVFTTHMSLDRLLEMLKSNDLSKVQEIHLLHLSSSNADPVAFKTAVQRATGVPVYIAQRGTV